MEVDALETLDDLEQEPGIVELLDRVGEVEAVEHLAHVGREPTDVVVEVALEVGSVGQELLEVVAGGVVEGITRSLTE